MTGISAYADGTINIYTGSGTGSGFTFANGVLSITENGNYQIIGNGTQTLNCIAVNSGVIATISLENVNIVSNNESTFDMKGATVELLLKGSNTLWSASTKAGIHVSPGNVITIDSKDNPGYFSGTLTVTGGSGGAGIGGNYNESGGTITVNGGTINANGGSFAAGIGSGSAVGGNATNGGIITINGGIVTATTFDDNAHNPACIGGGAYSDAGIITITGGVVVIKGGSGGSIGRGGPNGTNSSGSITVSGGTVYDAGYGIGMSGYHGVTASTATTITQNAVVFANTINPNATIASNAITKTRLPHTIDSNGNVTILMETNPSYGLSYQHKLIIPNGITFTINKISNIEKYLVNDGIIQNFGTIQGNGPIMNIGGTIINNGIINVSVTGASAKTGILGEWIQDIPPQFYTGNAITPDVTVVRPGTGTLIKNRDYIIKNYSNNTGLGTAMVTIEGIGNYAGTMTKTFTISSIGTIDLNNINTNNNAYQYSNNTVTINKNGHYIITGSTTTDRVVVQSGVTATITLDNASITSSGHALAVDTGATVTLLLKKSNILQTIGDNYAGLHVPEGSTILINSAGIPGSENGMLAANAMRDGAAIGSGQNGSSGIITIDGGTVNAISKYGGAAIGSGQNSNSGIITINGGTVNAISEYGAAIGSGENGSSGMITINGGTIYVNNNAGGAGIGSGSNGSISTITINGGVIDANSDDGGAAIGGGIFGHSGSSTITINGGTISAKNTGSDGGAGIGSGYSGSIGTIIITAGNINASCIMNGAGFGAGGYGNHNIITISGGIINATGSIYGSGIGGGQYGSAGSITINGGVVNARAVFEGTGIDAGTFSMNGNAIVFASSVSDNSPKTKGILFNGNTGIMYGNVILKQNATIPSGKTWTIASDQIFEISPNDTLTHNGIIYNNGTINNFGTITGSGQIIGNSVINEDADEYDKENIYEAEGKLAVADILDPQADLSGGIIGTIGFDDYDDENDYYDPIIDVIVLDRETDTFLYEIYIDETSNTYTSTHLVYSKDEVGGGGEFFPDIWESDDIVSSIEGIEEYRYQNGDIPSNPFPQDSIDVIIRVTVKNSKLSSVKIPGIGYIGFEENSGSASLLNDGYLHPAENCFTLPYTDPRCPCNPIWEKIQNPDITKNADLIIAAHRGIWGGQLGDGAPENSISAMRATRKVTNIIEMDVMKSKDNRLIITHDYTLSRLSNYSGPANDYWFNLDCMSDGADIRNQYKLKKRNGTVSNDRYMSFQKGLKFLKDSSIIALIDIKELIINTGDSIDGKPVNNEYNPETEQGRQNMKESWLKILQWCVEIAVKYGYGQYIAFKTPYTYEEITGNNGISKYLASRVGFMPMVQPVNPKRAWNLEHAYALINSWAYNPGRTNNEIHLAAIEINFNSLTDSYVNPDSITKYDPYGGINLLHYVSLLGLRPGIFSEDPVGPKGVSNRWAKWFLPDPNRNVRGNHLTLMSVPYFKTALITSDRPDIWTQIMSNYNSTQSLSSSIPENIGDATRINDMKLTENSRIIVKYQSEAIIINGLNQSDAGSDIMLYDLQGRLISKNKVTGESQMILPQNMQKGIYLLRISGNRQVSKKIIINQ
jgi:hypothetical protein